MVIQESFPKYITYQVPLSGVLEVEDLFNAKVNKGLRRDITRLQLANYRFVRESVDESYLLDKFLPLYKENVMKKNSPMVIDIKEKIIDHPSHQFPYEALSLYLDNEFLGGVIFSIREDSLSIAFKTFPTKLSFSVGSSVTMLADYYLMKHAIELHKNYVSLGKDRNLYGLNSAIGLAMYKLRLGALPYASSKEDNSFLKEFNWDESGDILMFSAAEKGAKVEKIFLLTAAPEDAEKRYGLLFGQKQCQVSIIAPSK